MFSFLRRAASPISTADHLRPLIADYIDKNDLSRLLRIEDIKVGADGQVMVVLFAHDRNPAQKIDACRSGLEAYLASLPHITKALVMLTTDQAPVASKQTPKSSLAGAKVIAVASGKGGVGKSTVALNLAVALSQLGNKVGILDADIYGPSLPRLVGQPQAKAVPGEDGQIIPITAYGLQTMSMGYLVDEATPMIWRGPMVQSALLQMLRDVAWDVDILVIDMPPGTGDIHLTLAQRVPLAGGVVVSTPQDIALIDARKGLEMFRKVAVPILGIVENMSYFCCPNCGHREDIFGHGGAQAEAMKIGVPFLGAIPLHTNIRELSDAGTPVASNQQNENAQAFMSIAAQVSEGLISSQRPVPRIIMED